MITKEEFKSKPKWYRIEAIIHDGQWYTVEKWAKQSCVKKPDILEYIENHKDVLIEKNNSYRYNADEIFRWYDEHDLDITKNVHPSNWPPKIWGGKTEAQHFIDTPRRMVTSLQIYRKNEVAYRKAMNIVNGYGLIHNTKQDRTYIFCIGAELVKERLRANLTEEEFNSLEPRIRNAFGKRLLYDCSDEFLHGIISFYQKYVAYTLKNQKDTMLIYLPEPEDRESQITEWIMRAFEKFDETQTVPFSGYIANTVKHWVYELPEEELGRDLASFQRNRKKIKTSLSKELGSEFVPEHEIIKRMGFDGNEEEYSELLEGTLNWEALKYASNNTWEESGEEKTHADVMTRFISSEDKELAERNSIRVSHILGLSLLQATEDTGNYDVGLELVEQLCNGTGDIISSVPEEFKGELWKELKSNGFTTYRRMEGLQTKEKPQETTRSEGEETETKSE